MPPIRGTNVPLRCRSRFEAMPWGQYELITHTPVGLSSSGRCAPDKLACAIRSIVSPENLLQVAP